MPESFGQSKIMFLTQGNPLAMIQEITNGRRRQRSRRFADPHAALDWCLENASTFVLFPAMTGPQN